MLLNGHSDQGWQPPRCFQACPTGALRVEYVEDVQIVQIVETENLEVLHPEYKTSPNVYYNRALFNRLFVVQTMVFGMDGYILNPTDKAMIGCLYVSTALLDNDRHCLKFLKQYRKGLYD